jgi:transposase-like protein
MDNSKRTGMGTEAAHESKQVRQHRSANEKRSIVEASFVAGATVKRIAQEHGGESQ